jgi:lipooligosaccharide transport system ATP-binding protein
VAGIDFEVKSGECFGFLGPNGAGKSSTMRMIHAFSPLTEGTLEVLGLDVSRHARAIKRRLGVVPQEDSLDPDLTVHENLIVYARYFGIRRARAETRAAELLAFLALGDKRDVRVPELSGGMRRRLVIARALINQPELLILDEPTTGLDPQARHLIWQKLRALRGGGVTMVLTTHYMEEAERLCDRLVIMDGGRILDEGTPAELVGRHLRREVVELRAQSAEAVAGLDALEARLLRELPEGTALDVERVGDTLFVYADDARRVAQVVGAIVAQDEHAPMLLHRLSNLEDVFLKLTGRELRD